WYTVNSPRRSSPVGMLRPNDLGLFDLHGNLWEWCQNRFQDFPYKSDPRKEDKVDGRGIRSLRGGAFDINVALNLRSVTRISYWPTYRLNYVGFRPARTFP